MSRQNISQKIKRSPIKEALLDIQTSLTPGFEVEELQGLHKLFQADFPKKELNTKWQTTFKVEKGKEPLVNSESTANGYFFKAADGKNIFQARIDGFTYNQVDHYTGWEDFSGKAFRYWRSYKKIANPIAISRVAIRFVNRIAIPNPVGDFEDYFKYLPNIPKKLPQEVAGFFVRTVLPDIKTGHAAIIQIKHGEGDVSSSGIFVTLDIDVFHNFTTIPSSSELMSTVAELRHFKNLAFFEILTKKAISLFE